MMILAETVGTFIPDRSAENQGQSDTSVRSDGS